MRNPFHKRTVVTAAIATGALLGSAGLASALTTTSQAPPAAAAAAAASQDAEEPTYQSSITVPQNPADENAPEDPAGEAAALAGLAKISPEKASQAATAAIPGTAGTPQLEDENGNVVYAVEVTTPSGVVEVKVDAGNGAVLHSEPAANEGSGKAANDAEVNDGPDTPGAANG
jgi:uncharacterized membrane protein YkoI